MDEKLEQQQLKYSYAKRKNGGLSTSIIILVILLAVLPFWVSFQDVLTKFIMNIGWYKAIQDVIVPYELKVVSTLLVILGFPVRVGGTFIEWTTKLGKSEIIFLAWNCVGWQTLIFFLLTLFTGLSGKHNWKLKAEAFLIGILGTYLINIARIVLVVVVYISMGRTFGVVFHDYFSSILSFVWIFVYWQFIYKYVLISNHELE